MGKQILLYSSIYPDTAARFLTELEAAKDDIPTVRVNTPGGDPYSTYGMIAKAAEVNAFYQIDGQCNSCGFYLVANAPTENVECLTVTTFIAHRAASWQEKYPAEYPNAIKEVTDVNVILRGMIEKNLPDFEKVMGVKLDDMFSMEGGYDKRMDVIINAKQAKAMGLVGKVNTLTGGKKKEIKALAEQYHIAAFSEEPTITAENKDNDMEPIKTLAELKAQFPAIAAEAKTEGITEGRKSGIEYERKRIAAWNRFRAVDAKRVDAEILAGTEVDMDVVAEMSVKMAAPEFLEAMKKQNTNISPDAADTADTKAETKEEKEAKAMLEAANKELNWK